MQGGSPSNAMEDGTGKILDRTEPKAFEEKVVYHKDDTKHLYSSVAAGVQSSSHLS